MIQEDYVSFEIAKQLKEKGFNTPLLTFYLTDKERKEGYFQIMAFTDDVIDNNHSSVCYLAPTLQMAMKWLRETYNIHIVLSPNKKMNNQYGSIIFVDKGGELHPQPTDFFHGTYEQACEAAITYCLTKLL